MNVALWNFSTDHIDAMVIWLGFFPDEIDVSALSKLLVYSQELSTDETSIVPPLEEMLQALTEPWIVMFFNAFSLGQISDTSPDCPAVRWSQVAKATGQRMTRWYANFHHLRLVNHHMRDRPDFKTLQGTYHSFLLVASANAFT